MGYVNSIKVLPKELIEQIQQYIDGEYIYIPRAAENRRKWGDNTDLRSTIEQRDLEIHDKYLNGISVRELSEEYFISTQGIYRILSKYRSAN